MDGFNFVHNKNYFNCFLVTVTFYYTIIDKIFKKFLCIFDIFKHARSVPFVHTTKNQTLCIMQYHAKSKKSRQLVLHYNLNPFSFCEMF